MWKSLPLMVAMLGLLSVTGCQCPPAACTAGTQACACLEGGSCSEGLVCAADRKCAPAVSAGVQISDAAARGCEFLLTEAPGAEVVMVEFKNGARGTWIREAPRVAITVVAGGDTALADAVQLGVTGSIANLSLSKASCVDQTGQRLASTLTIR